MRQVGIPYAASNKPWNPNKQQSIKPNYILDYNDPMIINSAADAALNIAALNKKYDWSKGDNEVLNWIGNSIFAAPFKTIPATLELLYEGTLKPLFADKDNANITAGDRWTAVGLNALTNIGETLDIVANPVKGFVMEGPEGFAKGIGWDPGGRPNYDYDFEDSIDNGFVRFLAEFGAEFISDPINWITIGGSGVVKGIAKSTFRKASKAALKTVGSELLQEATETVLKKGAKKGVQQAFEELIDPKHLGKVRKIATKILRAGHADDFSSAVVKATKQVYDQIGKTMFISPDDMFQNPQKIVKRVLDLTSENISNSTTQSVLNGLNKIVMGTDYFERTLLKAAVYTTSPGVTLKIGKSIVKGIWSDTFTKRALIKKIAPYLRNGIVPIEDFAEFERAFNDALRTLGKTQDLNGFTVDAFKRNSLHEELSDLVKIVKGLDKEANPISVIEYYITSKHPSYTLDTWLKHIDELSQSDPLYKTYKKFLDVISNKELYKGDMKQLLLYLEGVADMAPSKEIKTLMARVSSLFDDAIKEQKAFEDLVKHTDEGDTPLFRQRTKTEVKDIEDLIVKDGVSPEDIIVDLEDIGHFIEQYIVKNPNVMEWPDEIIPRMKPMFDDVLERMKAIDTEFPTHGYTDEVHVALSDLIDGMIKKNELDDLIAHLKELEEYVDGIPNYGNENLGIMSDRLRLLQVKLQHIDYTKDYITEFDNIEVQSVKELIHLARGRTLYTVKLSSAYTALDLARSEKLVELFDDIAHNSGYIDQLFDVIEDKALAKTLRTKLEQYVHSFQAIITLVDDLSNATTLDKAQWVYGALFDTIQNMGRIKLNVLKDSPDYYINQIMKKMLTQANMPRRTRRLTNAALLGVMLEDPKNINLPKGIKTLDEWLMDSGVDVANLHDARVDVNLTKFLTENYFKPNFPDGAHIIYVDFESTGLNPAADSIIQGAMDIDGVSTVFRIMPEEMPSVSVLRAIAPKWVDPDSEKALVDWFKSVWNKEAAEAAGERWYDDPRQFLKELIANMSAAGPHKKILAGQNIIKYDIPLLRKNIIKYLGADYQRQFDELFNLVDKPQHIIELTADVDDSVLDGVFDTYIAALKNKNIESALFYTADEYDTVYESLNGYIKYMLEHVGSSEATGIATLLPQFNRTFTSLIDDIIQKVPIKRYDVAGEAVEKLKAARESIVLALASTRTINQKLMMNLAEIDSGSLFNISYYMVPMEGFGNYSSKIFAKRDLIDSYFERLDTLFKDLDDDLIDLDTAHELTSIAQRIDRIAVDIPDLALLKSEIKDYYKDLTELLHFSEYTSQWGAYLRKSNTTFRQTLASVNYMYHYDPAFRRFVQDNVKDEKLLEIILKPRTLNKRFVPRELLDISPGFRDTFREVIDLLDGFIDNLDTLHRLKGMVAGSGMYRAGKLGDFAAQELLYEKVHKLADVLKTIKTDEAKEELYKVLVKLGETEQYVSVAHIARMSPEDFYKHMVNNTPGVVIVNRLGVPAKYLDGLDNAAIKKAGIIVHEGAFETVYMLPKSVALETGGMKYSTKVTRIKGMSDDLTEALQEMFSAIDIVAGDSIQYSTRQPFTEKLYKNIYDRVSEAVRKDMRTPEELADSGWFKHMSFDYTNLGTLKSQRIYNDYTAINPLKNYLQSLNQTMFQADAITKFKIMFFNDKSGIHLNELFKTMTDKEIYAMFKEHPEFTFAALITDVKSTTGYKVVKINPTSVKQIASARALDAIIVSKPTLNTIISVINKREINSKVVKWINNNVVDALKAGYLSSIGFLFRNTVDSFFKNLIELEGVGDVPKFIRHTFETSRNFYRYIQDERGIIEIAKKLTGKPGALFSAEAFDVYFDAAENIGRKEIFKVYHMFIHEGPSAGLSTTMINQLMEAGKIIDDATFWRKFIWRNPVTHGVMKANTYVEHIARLSKYTWEIGEGADELTAMWKVLRTHFDYNVKSHAQTLLEVVVPFMSFTIENTKYWLDSLSNSGKIASVMRDFMMPIYNLDEYDVYELNNNRSLQYNILAGNLIMDNNMTLKLNTSIMDMFNLLFDPINTMKGRVLAPITALTEPTDSDPNSYIPSVFDKVMENLPLIGPTIQRYSIAEDPDLTPLPFGLTTKGYTRTQALATLVLPSIVGGTYRTYYFSYGSTIYSTRLKETYIGHLDNGAYAIKTDADVDKKGDWKPSSFYPKWKKNYPKINRYSGSGSSGGGGRQWAKKSYIPYHSKYQNVNTAFNFYPYFKGTYVPKAYRAYAQERVIYRARGSIMRQPGYWRNIAHIAPSLYKKMYSPQGVARSSQMALQYRMR